MAPQFAASAAQASLYGAVVLALFVLNISVAVWKPFNAVKFRSVGRPAPGQGHRDA